MVEKKQRDKEKDRLKDILCPSLSCTHTRTHTTVLYSEFRSGVNQARLSLCNLLSVDDPISVVLMQQMDSLLLTIHHLPHQNLSLPLFTNEKWVLDHLFPQENKNRLTCHQTGFLLDVMSLKIVSFYFVQHSKK